MSVRMFVEICNGLRSLGRGTGHLFDDFTDRPFATVQVTPVRYYLRAGGESAPTRAGKPPYRVPTMAEVAAVPANGLTVVSTFAGCGGSCLGYRAAGFTVLWANEFVPAAAEVYRLNHPGTVLDVRDVRAVTARDVLDATGLGEGEIDVLDGSPPCATFSSGGEVERGWGKVKAYSDTAQRVDDLFFEFVRLLGGLKPRAFVAENVSGLVKGKAKGYFLDVLAAMKAHGYRVDARSVDAQWLGVPQARKRLLFLGVRADLGVEPACPRPLPYRYTTREALGWLDDPDARPTPAGDKLRLPIADVKRLCGFPDDFALTGSYARQWERLGRAVPPVMMAAVAAAVRDRLPARTGD